MSAMPSTGQPRQRAGSPHSQPAVFAPDYAPEEIAEIAERLRKDAGLPREPLGTVANPNGGESVVDKVKDTLD
jgi:hypothetical protein